MLPEAPSSRRLTNEGRRGTEVRSRVDVASSRGQDFKHFDFCMSRAVHQRGGAVFESLRHRLRCAPIHVCPSFDEKLRDAVASLRGSKV